MHPAVIGWPMLKDEWQGHHQEPFADAWNNPQLLQDRTCSKDMVYMTSISCPYIKGNKPHTPKYQEFISEAKKYCEVAIAIIGRDRNILETQQNRLRGGHTTPLAIDQFEQLHNCFLYQLIIFYQPIVSLQNLVYKKQLNRLF